MSKILDEKLAKKSLKERELLALRHTTEHVLHTAMQNLYPGLKKAMGPATDDGFYFDFDLNQKISEADFPVIEKEMKRLIEADLPLTQQFVDNNEAKRIFAKNPYKLDWIENISTRNEKISIFRMGQADLDLCSGPHVKSTGEIKAFKLLSVAGAYWHGDEKNKMLTRIYGTCFPTPKELDQYLEFLEEAKLRDHRVLGPQLDLFVISNDIGRGLPLLTPKGTVIRNEILQFERELEKKNGFLEVWTPHIAKNDLYKRTGHWQHYQEVMYAPFGIDDETYVLKPMNCPHHYMIYESRPRSYRDLPIRLTEPGTCYRYEKSGELGGLTRVRALTIDDSHILMRENQIHEEFDRCINMVKEMFNAFGLLDYYVRLSLNDPKDSVKYIADPQTWKKAGELLEQIIVDNQLKYQKGEGEASFYGPKIDFMVKDAIGREWQMSTLQLDLFMAKKLKLVYIDESGQKQNPVILHRGLTGSLERTIGILIEHYKGAFPLWLAPVQAAVIPIAERHMEAARKACTALADANIRTSLDDRSESMQAKIRDATLQKIPYMGIIGDREAANGGLSIRTRKGKDLGVIAVSEFLSLLKNEIRAKS
jgi:threonyl-tRNA synthetase